MWVRLILAVVLVSGFAYGWRALDRVTVHVVGQPSTAGPIQSDVEEPFFTGLTAQTGLPLNVDYRPTDTLGFKDNFQLPMLKRDLLDLVSLRFTQNAATEPTLLGFDLPGLSTSFGIAQTVVRAYGPTLDRRLRENFDSKLLGIWPFGPQVFFCRVPITGLADMRGLKVRVGNDAVAPLLSSLGATPVVIAFEDVGTALRAGLIDCAISSASSANAAGWPADATHYYPLSMQMGLNGYVISLKIWNRLTAAQQSVLQAAFDEHIRRIWERTVRVDADAASCTIGGPCLHGHPYHLASVPLTSTDERRIRDAFETTTFADWAAKCDKVRPGCSQDWRDRVLPALAQLPNGTR